MPRIIQGFRTLGMTGNISRAKSKQPAISLAGPGYASDSDLDGDACGHRGSTPRDHGGIPSRSIRRNYQIPGRTSDVNRIKLQKRTRIDKKSLIPSKKVFGTSTAIVDSTSFDRARPKRRKKFLFPHAKVRIVSFSDKTTVRICESSRCKLSALDSTVSCHLTLESASSSYTHPSIRQAKSWLDDLKEKTQGLVGMPPIVTPNSPEALQIESKHLQKKSNGLADTIRLHKDKVQKLHRILRCQVAEHNDSLYVDPLLALDVLKTSPSEQSDKERLLLQINALETGRRQLIERRGWLSTRESWLNDGLHQSLDMAWQKLHERKKRIEELKQTMSENMPISPNNNSGKVRIGS